MRKVTYKDPMTGLLKVSLVRDSDPDEDAATGIPVGPPDLELIDWRAVKQDINKLMVEQNLMTWEDVMKHPVGLKLFETVIKRHVSALYRMKES